MSTSKGFSPRQKASLEKALNYCHGMMPAELILDIQKLVDRDECSWNDCSIVCEAVFLVAYGKRGLFVSHKEQDLDRQFAIAQLHDIIHTYKQTL